MYWKMNLCCLFLQCMILYHLHQLLMHHSPLRVKYLVQRMSWQERHHKRWYRMRRETIQLLRLSQQQQPPLKAKEEEESVKTSSGFKFWWDCGYYSIEHIWVSFVMWIKESFKYIVVHWPNRCLYEKGDESLLECICSIENKSGTYTFYSPTLEYLSTNFISCGVPGVVLPFGHR